MQKRVRNDRRSGILLCLLVLGVITALAVLPNFNRSKAGGGSGLIQRTTSLDADIPKMWDIREDKMSQDKLEMYRQRLGRDASFVADVRDRFVRGEEALKQQLPTAKVEYNTDIRTPEVITPDVYAARVEWLSRPSNEKRSNILREFIRGHQDLVGVNGEQIDQLEVSADYTNPNGILSYAHLDQKIGGVPVFRGEVKAGFRQSGEIIRVINNLAPGLDYNTVSRDFGDAGAAVRMAADHIKHKLVVTETVPNAAESTDLKVVFGSGDWATTAEKMYFPTEPGIVVPAWRVLIWQPVNAYYVIADANTGTILWHKNITDDQAQSATYDVYTTPTAYINVADHAAPLSPYGGPTSDPATNLQGTLLTRQNVTLIGNEAPNTFNQNGWITDGANITDGNSNEAGIDRDGTNGVDAPQSGSPNRVFTSTWNPPPGNPAPGDAPLDAQAQRGAVIQMFYIMNLHHDTLYLAGFTEAARNFQQTNFTGMGVGNDRVSSEGQDSSGTNNANFATPADGGRGRMQMYLWTGPTPDRDGTADAHIVIHEVSHGVSNRLHNNGSGLGNQGGMMGEGWGDWYAHTMTAQPTDDPLGVHGMGGYSLANLAANFANNYYGIRRFPTAVKASTGGPMNRPHNPLTFGHINTGCDTTLGTTTTAVSSAYPRSPAIATSGNCSQVHNAGEIWKNTLWEVRGLYVTRKGFTNGTRDILDHVTNGMKLAPTNPMFLQERDAIIATALAAPLAPQAAADAADVREGFRRHGMGFSAQTISATSVVEAFDSPTVAGGTATVTSGNNLLEPNDCDTLNVALNNNSGDPATGISAVLSTTTPGITVTQANSAYPDMTPGQQGVANTTPYQVSIDNTVACYTTANFTLTITYTGGGGGSPLAYNFSLPVGLPGNVYTFAAGTGTIPAGGTFVAGSDVDDGAVTIPLPAGWTSQIYGVPVTSLSASSNGMLTANGAASTAFTNAAITPAAVGGTNPTLFPLWDDMIMTAANVTGGGIFRNEIGAAPNRQLVIEWRAQHFAETTNGPITINFAVVLNEGSNTVRYIYTSTGIAPNANGVSATVGIQRQQTGTQFTQHSFNQAVIMPGTDLTGTLPAGQCTPGSGPCSAVPDNPRADFDGDGKTDLSVFRPTEGNWYLQRSTAGFAVLNWGLAADTLIPGDFDGDGKADMAVFRPDANIANNDFFVLKSNGFVVEGTAWGLPGDIPISGDYDGDNKTDRAIWRPSEGQWYILNSGNGSNTVAPFGLPTDVPLSIDNNGDGKTNLAVFRPSENTWYIAKPTGVPATNFDAYPFGSTGDRLVQADYDGDNKEDVAVFRPSNGTWYILRSTNGNTDIVPFGATGDVPVPGDYDGDGKDDVAVYRAGTWYINQSTAGLLIQAFGLGSDTAIPNKYLPAAAGGGGGGAVTVTYSGAAVAIPDNLPAGVNINLPVTGVGTVSDLNFIFDPAVPGDCSGTVGDPDCAVDHSWVGDIIVKVTPPDGSPTVTIVDRIGVPTSAFGCNNNNFSLITLNDEGGLPAIENQGNPTPTTCNTANLFSSGNFSPNNPLSALDGENADGTWVINVSDGAGGDTGSVRRFSLAFNSGN